MIIKLLCCLVTTFLLASANPDTEDKCAHISKYSPDWTDECQDQVLKKGMGKHWKLVKDFYFEFRDKVITDDKEAVAKMMKYPIDISYDDPNKEEDQRSGRRKSHITIQNEEEFIKKYDFIFNKNLKCVIENHPYKDFITRGYVLRLHTTYGGVSFLKDCDFKRILEEDCPVVKVDHIDNDIEILNHEYKDKCK